MRTVLSAVALTGLFLGNAAAPDQPNALAKSVCSMLPTPRLKAETEPYFLGIATPDTVLAGPGETQLRRGEGHFAVSGATWSVYGQLVTVTRAGGTSRGIESGSQVVVVPWDYDPACRPVIWGRSSAWVPVSGHRFFYPRLRAESLWVGGVPTFDAFTPEADVYPSRYQSPVFPPGRKSISAEGLFDFFEILPVVDEELRVGAADRSRLKAWAASNREALERWPIDHLLRRIVYRADHDRAVGRARRMLGTYRLVLTAPVGESRTVFLRTVLCMREDDWMDRRQASDDPLAFQTVGARLRFWAAQNEADLESPDRNKRRGTNKWQVGWHDESDDDSSWVVEINPRQFRQFWDDDPVMKRILQYRDNWFEQHWDRQDFSDWLGKFDPTGLRLTQAIPLRNGGVLSLTAERISSTTSPCPSEQILTDDPSLPNPPSRGPTRN
jgi:hypothetical protein